MNISVLVNPESIHFKRVKDTVDLINQIQRYFSLSISEADWLPEEGKKVAPEKVLQLAEKNSSHESLLIAVIPNLDPGFFSYGFRSLYIVSTADWEERCAPPPLKIFLTYLFTEALLYFAVDMPEALIEKWAHDPPIGCFFDSVENLASLRLGMIGANLCGECEAKLFEMGLEYQALQSLEQLLTYVRGATIRRPRTTSPRIFIGHGRSEAWVELRNYLSKDLGLLVEEFNQESTAGVATTERLKEMLNRSRFAFLVMTAEDAHADERMHARENVVHEIGLFQGRLGFEKAIILKEAGVAEFSNIHGLTYIGFPASKLLAAKKEIRRVLEREGIIRSS